MIINSLEALETELNKPLTLVLAKTHACSICQSTLSFLKASVKGFEKFNVVEIYIDDNDEYRGKFMIFTVPTVMVYSEGKELLRESRFIDPGKISRLVQMMGD
jgi:thioredoxin-like negative regulator of GroEL